MEPTRVEPHAGLHCKGRLLALLENIWLLWKSLTAINGLAYYSAETKTTVKSITMKSLGLLNDTLYYNYFLISHPLIKLFFYSNLKIYIFIDGIQREGSSCCSNESDQLGPML
jgi:hypothetical protein